MFYRYLQEKRIVEEVNLDGLYEDGALFLIGGSPKLKEENLELFKQKGIVTMGINNASDLVKTNMWVGADKPVCYSERILTDSSILKFTVVSRRNEMVLGRPWKTYPNTLFMGTRDKNFWNESNFLMPAKDYVWWENTLFIALQMAWRFGFKRVYLCGMGFKISKDNQYAWQTKLNDREISINQRLYAQQVNVLNRMKKLFDNNHFQLINCTKDSALEPVYGYKKLTEAIEEEARMIPKTFDTNKLPHSRSIGKANEFINPPLIIGKHYCMALEHRKAILKSIPPQGRMLEWGSGDSTIWFRANMSKAQILISFEHDESISQKTQAVLVPCKNIPNLGEGREQVTEETMKYITAPLKYGKFDVILVDGISRSECLNLAPQLLKEGGVIFLHDSQREWYNDALKGFKVIQNYQAESDYIVAEMKSLCPLSPEREGFESLYSELEKIYNNASFKMERKMFDYIINFTGLNPKYLAKNLLRKQGNRHGDEFREMEPQDRSEIDWYYVLSEKYLFANIIHRPRAQELTAKLKQGKILDYGGGAGVDSIALARTGRYDVHYFDIGLVQKEFVKYVSDIEKLGIIMISPFYENKFNTIECITSNYDVIIVRDLLEHIPDYNALLNHLLLHLNSGGYLFEISDFNITEKDPQHFVEHEKIANIASKHGLELVVMIAGRRRIWKKK